MHRIEVKDFASEKMAPHYFVLDDESKIEGVDIKDILEWIQYSDFCECNHLQVSSILDNQIRKKVFWMFWKQA